MTAEDSESLAACRLIDAICDEFQRSQKNGQSPKIEAFLGDLSPPHRQLLLLELIGLEADFRVSQHERPMMSDYAPRFPELPPEEIATLLKPREDSNAGSTAFFVQVNKPIDLNGPISHHGLIGRKLHIYQCVSLVGEGAMGQVYLALHDDLHRHCALKILAPRRGDLDAQYVAQFHQEGQAAAALIHPNIVALHAIGRIGDTHFLEMEYVRGRSLQQLIREEGPLPADRALRLATMIAEGLAAAHRAGIIHRDLKPDNVLITLDGIAKIGDFGMATRITPIEDASGNGICGTPNYMAPELFVGQAASPASDVYALGLCLYQMLIGRLPWLDASLNHLVKFGRTEEVPNVCDLRPELSPAVAECVAMLTAQSVARRPENAAAASMLLHAVMGSERDIESLLIEAFRNETAVTWIQEGGRYSLTRQLPGDRRQIVFIEATDHAAHEKLLLIYSTCCRAHSSYFEQALRQNWIVKHGSLAIRDIDGESMFVVINAYPRSTVAPEEIRRSVTDIAAQADEVERHLTGIDRY